MAWCQSGRIRWLVFGQQSGFCRVRLPVSRIFALHLAWDFGGDRHNGIGKRVVSARFVVLCARGATPTACHPDQCPACDRSLDFSAVLVLAGPVFGAAAETPLARGGWSGAGMCILSHHLATVHQGGGADGGLEQFLARCRQSGVGHAGTFGSTCVTFCAERFFLAVVAQAGC